MAENKISNVHPDFSDLVANLEAVFKEHPEWETIYPFTAVGAFIDSLAAIGTMWNYSIEKAVQESFSDTAVLPSSHYQIARMLGASIHRNSPASVTCNLVVSGNGSIPQYTQFQVDGVPFYNAEQIIFPAGNDRIVEGVVLHQGTIVRKRFLATGKAYQTLVIGENFTTSEHFISVRVGTTNYVRQKEPLWYKKSDNPFWDQTRPDGSTQLVFGNGEYGNMPESGATISVTYAECLGADGNSPSAELDVQLLTVLSGITALTGITLADSRGTPAGGKSYESAEDMQYAGPRRFAANSLAVRRQDWETLCLEFPLTDVVDATTWGEHEERFISGNPPSPINMNVVHVCPLLSSSTLDSVQTGMTSGGAPILKDLTQDFKEYIESLGYVMSTIVVREPKVLEVGFDVQVFVASGSVVQSTSSAVTQAFNKFFSRKRGALGATYYQSDLIKVVQSISGVDYSIISNITTTDPEVGTTTAVNQISLLKNQYATVGNINISVLTTQR